MNENTPNPPLSSVSQNQPQDTLLQSGAFDPPFTPGTLGRLNRFEIIRLLGEGGMGQVYLAREPLTDTTVAVKIMKPQMAADPQSVHRFLIEARHMYRLSHPRILRVLEVSDRKEGPYYVMPYIAGGSLLAQYKPGEPMPDERILSIARQVAEALAHAHTCGLIHRDLKPANVLLDKDGNAFLTDFGLVRTVFNDSMVDATASHLEGTAPYMSPAVARGEAEDTRCDIYAFGAVLYELLTAQPPYTGRTPQMILDQILRGPPLPIRQVNPKANPALAKIAEACMARELRDRYASMGDVVADLAKVAQGATPRGQRAQPSRLPKIAPMLVGALVLTGLAVLGISKLSGSKPVAGGADPGQPTSPPSATAEKMGAATAQDQFTWTTNNGAITITRYTGPRAAITIPSVINGLPVTAIGYRAFEGCHNIDAVTIPDSVTFIDIYGLGGCANLTNITWGKGISDFSAMAVYGSGMTSVTVPASLKSVWENPFACSSKLMEILVEAGNPHFSSSADGVLFNKEQTRLVGYPSGKAGSYVVPDSVTSIGDCSFKDCFKLSSVAIPSRVTQIEECAFEKCTSLTSVTIPNAVTNIGNCAFRGCSSLATVTIPKSVTSFGVGSFVGCSGLNAITVDPANPSYSSSADGVVFNKDKTCLVQYPSGKAGNYTIPDGVSSIGAEAFRACKYLTSVTMPDSVTSLDDRAFYECDNITAVYFKGNVPRFGNDVFGGAGKATVYYRPGTKGWDKEFGGRPTAVWEPAVTDPYQFSCAASNGAVAIVKYTGEGGEINIPATISGLPVTSIQNEAFLNCSNVTSVIIPNSVVSIGWGAFRNCTGMTRVTIPNSVTNIRDDAFMGCSKLSRVRIPASVSNIGWTSFAGCGELVSILVDPLNPNYSSSADGVLFNKDKTRILCYPAGKKGSYAIPASVTSIGDWSFRDSDSLSDITIPNGVNNIGEGAFWDCSSLTKVTLPAGVTDIQPNLFGFCGRLDSIMVDSANPAYSSVDGVVYSKDKTKLVRYPSGKAGSYVIPTQVVSIAWGSFEGSPGLAGVTIPKGVKSVENYTFKNCTNLTSVTIPDSVISIGQQTFLGCASLTSATIPASVISIRSRTFQDCASLTKIVIPNGVTSIGDRAFQSCSSLRTVTIPDSVTSIAEAAFELCTGLTGVTIPKGVKSVEAYTFKNCTNLTSVTIPDSVTVIGWDAFKCTGLTTVSIPDSVTEIVGWSFAECKNLASVTIGNGVTKLGNAVFWGCVNLTNAKISRSVKTIGNGAFQNCTKLPVITIPDSVRNIGVEAFRGCSSLTTAILGSNVDNLERGAFGTCTNLRSITIPDRVTQIAPWMFGDCSSLTNVTIGSGVTNIEDSAFRNCVNLTDVYFKGNAPTFDGRALDNAPNAIIYYLHGTTGWGAEFCGRPTAVWHPQESSAKKLDQSSSVQQNNQNSYAARRRQRAQEASQRSQEPRAPAPNYTGPELQKHLEAYQEQVIRDGLPPLPLPLSPESDKKLIADGVLPQK